MSEPSQLSKSYLRRMEAMAEERTRLRRYNMLCNNPVRAEGKWAPCGKVAKVKSPRGARCVIHARADRDLLAAREAAERHEAVFEQGRLKERKQARVREAGLALLEKIRTMSHEEVQALPANVRRTRRAWLEARER